MSLPTDGHVHTEWSWDTVTGSMLGSCERALELGLPSVAFTEHADLTSWLIPEPIRPLLPDHFRVRLRPDGVLEPPDLDVSGYLACVEECRERFPSLRILSGVELSEPHWHGPRADALLAAHDFDRVLGSVHSLREGGHHHELTVVSGRPPGELLRAYLGEVLELVESTADFAVLAHIDYALRSWPAEGPPFVATDFEEEFRTVLRALKASGRALEVNTKVPLPAEVVRWWFEAGGPAVTFGSDAHEPGLVGHGFTAAAALAEASGFRPGHTPHDFWRR
ncbi:histidinol-phosphatase (PHP family) [Amycolatopsis tolypomycina]|uniref:Histidinol-phosphatase n=1 Tax=Amycolatopsis tolypomycina TaxID=208445 RepID=A0A1H4VX38_9PSEU|nr:PHP domain-containing protein [Amycolatopsis tolypomycina]SEC85692.1 histidinol-phosphatase (PHP family) [Amycolatopsis tolypomycina]